MNITVETLESFSKSLDEYFNKDIILADLEAEAEELKKEEKLEQDKKEV